MARVPQPRARPARAAAAGFRRPGARRRQAEARPRGEGHPARDAAAAQHAGGPISTWRIRSSAATRRRRSRCAARSAWPTTSTKPSACCSRAARCRRKARSRPTSPATIRRRRRRRSSTTPRRRARCSTGSATRTATATATARRPDGKPLVLERWSAPTLARAAGRRAVEEEHGRDRHPDRVQEGQAAGAAQDGAAGQDPDAQRRLERRLSGRRELHAAALRAERRPGEPGALRAAGVRRALRRGAQAARFAGAHEAVRPDDRARASPTRRGG